MRPSNQISYHSLKEQVRDILALMLDGKLEPDAQHYSAVLLGELMGRLENTTIAQSASNQAYSTLMTGAKSEPIVA